MHGQKTPLFLGKCLNDLYQIVEAFCPARFRIVILVEFIHADKRLQRRIGIVQISMKEFTALVVVVKIASIGIIRRQHPAFRRSDQNIHQIPAVFFP